jgi:hypothetical protein
VYDEGRLVDRLQVAERLACNALPFAESCHLRRRDLGPGRVVQIICALGESGDEGFTGALARFCRRKKNLLQNRVSPQLWIAQELLERWLLQVHDVLAAAGSRRNEN